MKVLLIGSEGRIGSRYRAILNYMEVEFACYDPKLPEEPLLHEFDKWIIASPTHTHFYWCSKALEMGKTFLCEKPLSESIEECERLVAMEQESKGHGYVVCNYKYVVKHNMAWRLYNKGKLSYNYYNPGDRPEWGCCQLIYLDEDCDIKTTSPVWKFRVNSVVIDYKWLEWSYVRMIEDFLKGNYQVLWSLQDGLNMTAAVLKRLGHV